MNRESERKRLLEILNKTIATKDENTDDYIEWLADLLLDNGIVVPPSPVGERVFIVMTDMPFIPDDVYECKIKAWMKYEDKFSPLVEIVEEGTLKGLAVNVHEADLFTSMAAAQTILEVKKKKAEKMLKGEEK